MLSGYVASDDDLNRVKQIAASVPNTIVGNVIVAPWPQCEALRTLQKPLLVADRPTIDIGASAELHSGDLLKIQVSSPAQISYLYVSYIQADGSVVHLVQPNALVPQPTLPRQTLVFGSGTDGQPKFTVSPPFGREMIIAIASRSPLFDHELPMQQTERDYLSELRRALLYKPVPDMPDRELAATITTLTTSASVAMMIRLLFVIALLGGASIILTPASAEEAPSPNDITCALDPNCPKPQPQAQPQEKTRDLFGRGITVEGKPAEQPLSVNLYVNFAYNSADLTSDARITLDRLGTALRDPRLAAFSFLIAGHTDAKGGVEFNQKLSERRAEAVTPLSGNAIRHRARATEREGLREIAIARSGQSGRWRQPPRAGHQRHGRSVQLKMTVRVRAAGIDYEFSALFPFAGVRPDAPPNLLFFGKPFGASRPASARLPRQSASSLSDRV